MPHTVLECQDWIVRRVWGDLKVKDQKVYQAGSDLRRSYQCSKEASPSMDYHHMTCMVRAWNGLQVAQLN
jgi:hypothetical protein